MRYLILFSFLLTGCNNDATLRERYTDARFIIDNGLKFKGDLKGHRQKSFIYVQKEGSATQYGYDYRRAAVIIKFKARF